MGSLIVESSNWAMKHIFPLKSNDESEAMEVPVLQQVKSWSKKAIAHALLKGTEGELFSLLKDFVSNKQKPEKKDAILDPVRTKRKGRPPGSKKRGVEDSKSPSELAVPYKKKRGPNKKK